MKKKIVIIVVVLVLVLAVGGYFLWKKLKDNKDSKGPETTPEEAKQQAELQALRDSIGSIKPMAINQVRIAPKTRISEPIISNSGTVSFSNVKDRLVKEAQQAELKALRDSIGSIKPMSINQVRIAPKTRISEPLPLRRTIQPLF